MGTTQKQGERASAERGRIPAKGIFIKIYGDATPLWQRIGHIKAQLAPKGEGKKD